MILKLEVLKRVDMKSSNNYVELSGVVIEDLKPVADYKESKVYSSVIKVIRPSGKADMINIFINDYISDYDKLERGKSFSLIGRIHTSNYKSLEDNKMHTRVYMQVYEVKEFDAPSNIVHLSGKFLQKPYFRLLYINNKPVYIAETILLVHRYGRTYEYIPIVMWGSFAEKFADYGLGTKVSLDGYFQSREYTKCYKDIETKRVSYEVSVKNIEIIDE